MVKWIVSAYRELIGGDEIIPGGDWMKTWKFGIVGCGGIAAFHRDAIRDLPNARLVCVASRSVERAKAFGEAEGVDWTTSVQDLAERDDIDIVCVTTHSGSHAEIGEAVLRAGKHLIVEKPIAMTPDEARRLIALAEANGAMLSVISQRRFEPQYMNVKRLLDEGKLGKLLFIEAGTPYYRPQSYYDSSAWRGTIAEDGGALMNQGIHQIDLMLWLAGPARSVYGKTGTFTHVMEAEDLGAAVVSFANGAIGTVMSSTSTKPGLPPYLHLYTDRGIVKISGSRIVDWQVEGAEPLEGQDGADGTNKSASDPLAFSYEFHMRQLADCISAIEGGRPPLVTGEDGRRAVALVNGIYTSSSSGIPVMLE